MKSAQDLPSIYRSVSRMLRLATHKPLSLQLMLGLCALCSLQAQAQPPKADEVLLRFSNGRLITQDEFEMVYAKNHGPRELVRKHKIAQYRDYLKLYIHFLRKVMAAEALGLDTTAQFRNEIKEYIGQLNNTYLYEREVIEKLVVEAYARMQFELVASHILLRVAPDAAPADTLRAYELLIAIRDSIKAGQGSFGQFARRYSQDPSVRINNGELGFFSAFDMVYPFESRAYGTKPGQLAVPVRTAAGYHLIWVQDKVQNHGQRSAALISIPIPPGAGAADSSLARQRIYEAYAQLQGGRAFADIAATYSDDAQTALQGGDVGTQRLWVEMERRKRLMLPGEHSLPFISTYGWHILQVTGLAPLRSLGEMRADIKQRVLKDLRARVAEQRFIDGLKHEYNFRANKTAAKALLAAAGDANYLHLPQGAEIRLKTELLDQDIFSFADQHRSVRDLLAYRAEHGQAAATAEQALQQDLDALVVQELTQYEAEHLPQKYPEYRALAREYHDGILLFALMEQKVWRKAVEDSAGLYAYYTKHRDDFVQQQLTLQEVTASDSSMLISYRAQFEQQLQPNYALGRARRSHDGKVAAKRTTKPGAKSAPSPVASKRAEDAAPAMAVSSTAGLNVQDRVLDISSFTGQGVGYCSPIERVGGHYRIVCAKSVQHVPQPFEACRAEVVVAYQQQLEKEWLDELAKRYPVFINEQNLARLFRKKR